MQDLIAKIEALPPNLQQEVADFVSFLLERKAPKKKGTLKMDWRGALSDFRDQYTAVELQHKATEWRGD